MRTITRNRLRVQSYDGLSAFYDVLLGMSAFHAENGTRIYGYDVNQCCLEFTRTSGDPYISKPDDFYWKMGITLKNLDVAVDYLRSKGLSVPDPFQFRNIGYMTKIIDPYGFIIELLQQGFKDQEQPVGAGHPVGGQATLAHITLRVSNIEKARDYFENTLTMRLMSVQPVDEYGFCLYFYAWNEETLPDPDLKSVSNRSWLWARPYAFIELQHLEAPEASVRKSKPATCGFDGFSFANEESGSTTILYGADLQHLS